MKHPPSMSATSSSVSASNGLSGLAYDKASVKRADASSRCNETRKHNTVNTDLHIILGDKEMDVCKEEKYLDSVK